MEALLYNGDSGEIERSEVSNFEFARDCARTLLRFDATPYYRAQLAEGDRVLWDSDSSVIKRGQVVFQGVAA